MVSEVIYIYHNWERRQKRKSPEVVIVGDKELNVV